MNFFRRLKDNPALRQFAIFLSILGPGIVTGSVDNDAGGITTYSVAGALYGYKLLWTLIPSFIALLAVQEMNARMGVVTGKGLADLIRESFGVRITFYMFIFLLIADVGNTATEFAGVAGSMNIFGVSKYISVPLAAVAVWVLVLKGNYKFAERVFLLFSVFLLSYVVSAVLAGPDWKVIGSAIITPTVHFDSEYITTVLGIIGTTVAPWMQFYMQSAVIEKKLKVSDYKYTLWDVVLGCIATVVVAFFIIVACAATLHVNGIKINEASDAAMALKPLAGALAGQLFAFGLFVASIFSAAILPLATAYYVCEAFGFEAGIDKKFSEAPQFYFLFTIIILIGAGIILIPGAPLIAITIWTQVINAILLPVVLICMMVIINNKEIMEDYTNNRLQNIIGWATTAILIVLSAFLLFTGIGLG
jgi:NRAMP (natural resistance-associated macrophage protein)-like metal ion transporter